MKIYVGNSILILRKHLDTPKYEIASNGQISSKMEYLYNTSYNSQ